jgi:hypothetical protein
VAAIAPQRRRRAGVAALLVVLAGLAFGVYSIAAGAAGPTIAGGPVPRAASAACAGPLTPVGVTRNLNNARRLGHVAWIGGVVASDGYGAVKTAIEPIARSGPAQVVLRGWRCSDGRRLRFWFSDSQLPFSGRGSQSELASTGSERLTLRLAYLRRNGFGTVGYFLFSSPGKWVVEARQGRAVRGTVLFDFPG